MDVHPNWQDAAAPVLGPGNRFLAALSRAERSLVVRMGEPVELTFGATLSVPGGRVEHVVFPDEGLVSLVVELPDGTGAEVGVVGREGLVGLAALLGSEPHAPFRAVVQIPGHGLRVEAPALRLLAEGSRNLRDLVRRYAMASLVHASLTAACNVAHPLERRLARWLLGAHDRVGPGFPITQEYLALMLGARRPTVNTVLRNLKAAGLVRHVRGRVAIADRAGLEAVSCPCYRAGRAEFRRLMPRGFG